jgi:signal transduction histidine kinase
MMDEMKNETKKLNLLIDSLIKLSDIWELKTEKEKNNLKDIINDIINNCNDKIVSKKIEINLKVKKDIIIDANKSYLYILLSNLIWNAIKYNKTNWKIDIIYKNWKLIIKDNWIWIYKSDIDKIFDRFYKVNDGRNAEWFWIWLSLVKKISDIYWWNINVDSIEWKGSSFVIRF